MLLEIAEQLRQKPGFRANTLATRMHIHERQVYAEPSGRKILQSGGPSGRYAASVCFSSATSAPVGRGIVTPSPRGVRFFTGPRTQALQRDVLNARAERTRVT